MLILPANARAHHPSAHCNVYRRTSAGTTEHLVASVQHLATLVTGIQQSSNIGMKRFEQTLAGMGESIHSLQGQVASTVAMLATRGLRSPLKASSSPKTQSGKAPEKSSGTPSTPPNEPCRVPEESSGTLSTPLTEPRRVPEESSAPNIQGQGADKRQAETQVGYCCFPICLLSEHSLPPVSEHSHLSCQRSFPATSQRAFPSVLSAIIP